MLVVEMNTGQMLSDVQLASKGQTGIEFYGRPGGMVPMPDDVLEEIRRLVREPKRNDGDPVRRWLQRINDGVITLS